MDGRSFNRKKTVKVCGVRQLLQDQIEKEFQSKGNSTGYQDDVNNLRVCPNGEDYILVEFANEMSDPSPIGKTLKIAGADLIVKEWESPTVSTEDLKSEDDKFSAGSAVGDGSGGKTAKSKSRSKGARQKKISQLRFGSRPDQKPTAKSLFIDTKVKLGEDVATAIQQNPELKQIMEKENVELKKGGLKGTWNNIFTVGGKLLPHFPDFHFQIFSDQESSFSSQSSIDKLDDTPKADQSGRSVEPDESFNVSSLFLRYIISYHYEEYQKLESVSQQISFEVSESMTDTKLNFFARKDGDKNKFSKTVDKFIDFYQNQNQKMHQESIPKENKNFILGARSRFSLIVDSTQDGDKMVIYGEREKVQGALKFLESKGATSGTEVTTGTSSPSPKSTAEEKVIVDKLSCVLYQNVKVSVYQGDITKETADVIVNPANENLSHDGGAAGAIVKAGGKSIQDESDKFMRKRHYQSLTPGEVALTKAGNLPCNLIIHVVGPRWSSYYFKNSAKNDLYNAVYNCLTSASNYAAKSISIPAVSSGIFGVPVDICAEVLFTAVTKFLESASKTTPLKEIRFVNIDKKTTQVFAQEMEKRFRGSIQHEKVELFHSNAVVGNKNELDPLAQDQFTTWRESPNDNKKAAGMADSKKATVSFTGCHDSPSGRDNRGSPAGKSNLNAKAPAFSMSGSHTTTTPTRSYSNALTGDTDKEKDTASTGDTKGSASSDDKCSICLSDITDKKTLDKCGHSFCAGCINEAFTHQTKCPICSTVYGKLVGNQPPGKMTVSRMSLSLSGYEWCGTITITYRFEDGVQGPEHPNPGKRYFGTIRTAYLPDNDEGRKVLKLLQKAFHQKLTFTIGRSSTTGNSNVITWNDIHHKTKRSGGVTSFGYPDPNYLKRVQEELAAKGITE